MAGDSGLAELGRATLNYRLEGPADAPVVMFSHSLAASLRMWDLQAPVFAQRYRALRYDMRGHGGSAVPEEPFEMADLADDVVALMDHLQIARVHWVGLSMGGMIGQYLGLDHADRVISLALCSTTSRIPPEMAPVWQDRIAFVRRNGLAAAAPATLERWFTQACRDRGDPIMASAREDIAATSLEGYVRSCEAISRLDLTDRLGDIATPTLVVPGRHDPSTNVAASEVIADRIPGARLRVIEDASHFANVEQAEVWTQVVLGWVDENAA